MNNIHVNVRKKYLIGAGILVILIVASSFTVIILSYNDTSVTIGQNLLVPVISNEGSIFNPEFTGYVQSETTTYIYNSGWFNLEDVTVHVDAYFISNLMSDGRVKVGEDTNYLGSLSSGLNTSRVVTVKLNLQVARLAIEDGIIELELDISLSLGSIPYSLEFQRTTQTEYEAPFSP